MPLPVIPVYMAAAVGRAMASPGGRAAVGAAVAPSVRSVPFIGWVLAGVATMIGMDQGAEIGGSMATSLADCDPDLQEDK